MSGFMLSAKIIGADTLAAAFRNAGEITKKELGKAVDHAAGDLKKLAVPKTPHKHGMLQQSIEVDKNGPYFTSDNIFQKVGTDKVYGLYQEMGARKDGSHVVKNYSSPGTGPFFMRNAKEEVRPKLTEYLRKALTNIIDSLAGK